MIMIKHEQIEKNVGLLIVLTLFVVLWGGLLEIVPLFFQKSTTTPVEGLKAYSAEAVAGREIYLREGCYNCHSQMIRPFRAETERYGHYSVAGEFVYDHPFQWGSKRTGPDLQRVGGRYSDEWQRAHLINPRDVVPESNMPAFAFLANTKAKDSVAADIEGKMGALRTLANLRGLPTYSDADIKGAKAAIGDKTELDVLIVYLQGLGTALKTTK
nr:cytochrome-c oxidase, cbb3-type subunit II [Dechloromonas sp. A34]